MPSKIDPQYPRIDKRIAERSTVEKYAPIFIAVVAILGSAVTIYTSIVTKLEIGNLKQAYIETKVAEFEIRFKEYQISNKVVLEKLQKGMRELDTSVDNIENKNMEQLSVINRKLDNLTNKFQNK